MCRRWFPNLITQLSCWGQREPFSATGRNMDQSQGLLCSWDLKVRILEVKSFRKGCIHISIKISMVSKTTIRATHEQDHRLTGPAENDHWLPEEQLSDFWCYIVPGESWRSDSASLRDAHTHLCLWLRIHTKTIKTNPRNKGRDFSSWEINCFTNFLILDISVKLKKSLPNKW